MEKVLFVDDEPNVLNAFKRRLSNTYEFVTSSSPLEALQVLSTSGPFSVVISDMRMPEMQGIEFLREVAKKSPDSVRVMLTGLADQRTVVRAINDGAVFRFINKPCSLEEFEKTLSECMAQRRLIIQERDLLQNTLGGVIGLMTDLLSFIDPVAVQHGSRVRKILKEIGKIGQIPMVDLELSAMLRGIGKLSLPLELLLKCSQEEKLNEVEQRLVNGSIQTSARLLRQIPRLERVSSMLETIAGVAPPKDALQARGILAITIAEKIAVSETEGETVPQTLTRILSSLSAEEAALIKPLILSDAAPAALQEPEGYNIGIPELCPGQMLMADIKDKNGKLLLRKGFSISPAVIERIKNHHELVGIPDPIIVNERIPTRGA